MHKFPYRPKCGACHDRCNIGGCDRRDNDCRRDCRGSHDCGRGCPRDHGRDCRSSDCDRRPPPRHGSQGCYSDLLIGLLIGTMLGDCCRHGGDRYGR
ncbi:MAG: hypothetical protein SO434_07680 [Eubacteriales bacterium]|nr:hypothetical protein [Eubacteriales bacterium]